MPCVMIAGGAKAEETRARIEAAALELYRCRTMEEFMLEGGAPRRAGNTVRTILHFRQQHEPIRSMRRSKILVVFRQLDM